MKACFEVPFARSRRRQSAHSFIGFRKISADSSRRAGRLRVLMVLLALTVATTASAQSVYENYTFTNLAGPVEVPGWHDGNGSAARFAAPHKLTADRAGNVYVADFLNHTIRKITADGMVTTLAGSAGEPGNSDGTGSAARFNTPAAVAVDNSGNVYVAEFSNHTIRKITPSGMVTTLAGLAGVPGYANGTGRKARFADPVGVTVDSAGNVYVADSGSHTIRKITPAGRVTTFAGRAGVAGSANGTRNEARFFYPFGVVVDSNGNVYVADLGNHTIRKITRSGVVTTIAGRAGAIGSSDGTGSAARFNQPYDVLVANDGNLIVADTFNHTLRKITPSKVVTTLTGSAGNSGSADGTLEAARFYYPTSVGGDGMGNIYVTDYGNFTIRKVATDGAVTTVAGATGGGGSADGPNSAARFNFPAGIAVDHGGNVYVSDLANHVIRKISAGGMVTTLAGSVGSPGGADGTNSTARFANPYGVAVDANGVVYVSDTSNHAIRKITPDGVVTTFAGRLGTGGSTDGTGDAARFFRPFSIAIDAAGNLYVTDTWNQTIRKITPGGEVTTLTGKVGVTGTNDGTGSAARFNFPEGVAVDGNGNVFVADFGNSTVRKITPAGEVTTFAGMAGRTGSTDGTGSEARFNGALGVAADNAGNVFVTDFSNSTIRKITPAGIVTTLAGFAGKEGTGNGTGTEARFARPECLAVDGAGNIYVSDTFNHTIRIGFRALPDSPTVDLPIAGVGVVRQLYVTNLTTTSWSWRILRQPAGSTAQLSSPNAADPTFTPDVADLYIIQFEGRDNAGRVAIGSVSIVADATAPTLEITSPTPSQRLENGLMTVAGTADDDQEVARVWLQLNGGAWMVAAGTTNWMAQVALAAGTNVVSAYAEDLGGNLSATQSVDFFFASHVPVTVQVNGSGSVTPNYNGQPLEIWKSYKMTAAAGSGYVFSNWVGGTSLPWSVLSESATLQLVMQSNLVLQANFVPNPFVSLKGIYNGLFFESNNVQHGSSGFFTMALTDKGSYSGTLQMGTNRYGFAGAFNAGGLASQTVARRRLSPVQLDMALELSAGADLLTGTVSDGIWDAALVADRAVFNAANPATMYSGKYTIIIPGGDNNNVPEGHSYASMTVSNSGVVKLSGYLADGSKLSRTTTLSKDGHFPLYVPLYSGKGSLLSWLTLMDRAEGDVHGQVSWFKPPSSAKYYPGGFMLWTDVLGSRYQFTSGVPVLNFSTGQVWFADGNLTQSFTNDIALAANNSVINLSANALKLELITSSGVMTGSVVNPVVGGTLKFKGAVLQKQNFGAGYFPGTNQSGKLVFEAVP